MIVHLTPPWSLTDEHSSSSYGQPVFVQKDNPEAYKPDAIIRAYTSWSFQPAKDAVIRMSKLHDEHDDDERAFIAKFIR
jgi:hypothetical protein